VGSNGGERLVRIAADSVLLEGNLSLPEGARGIVLFAHGSGSSRRSPRNRNVARLLNQARLATLLVDLLSPEEEIVDLRTAQMRFNIGLLAERLVAVTDWLVQRSDTRPLRIGYFGARPVPQRRWWRQQSVPRLCAPSSRGVGAPIWPDPPWRMSRRQPC
jgi:putative phosphoribosyl transferase